MRKSQIKFQLEVSDSKLEDSDNEKLKRAKRNVYNFLLRKVFDTKIKKQNHIK